MSNGRPADLPFAGWATGNYPAGANPWNGTSKRTAPVNSYYEPAIQAIAQHDNYVIGSLWDAVSGLLNHIGQMVAFNWSSFGGTQTPGGATGTVHVKKFQWARMDSSKSATPKRNRQGAWFCAVEDEYGGSGIPGGGYIMRSNDGGESWVAVVSPTLGATPDGAQVSRFTVLPNGAIVVPRTTYSSSGNSTVFLYAASNYARTTPAHNAASDADWSLAEQLVQVTSDGESDGAILVGQRHVSPYTTQAVKCNFDGSTWTDISSKVPASLQTGAATPYRWFMASSPGRMMLFRDKTSETKFATIEDITANWTERSSPVSTGESAQALCYSQDIDTFFLCVYTGTDTKIFKSTTGTSFGSVLATISGQKFTSIKGAGNLLVAVSAATGSGADAYDKYMNAFWYSSDAGVTWARVPSVAQGWDDAVAGDAYWKHNIDPQLAEARNENGSYQFVAWSGPNALKSLTFGKYTTVND